MTLGKRYYDMRKESFSDCDVYFHVNWTEQAHDFYTPGGHLSTFRVQPLEGIWKASFAALAERIELGVAVLISKSFYLFNLNDPGVFERLL